MQQASQAVIAHNPAANYRTAKADVWEPGAAARDLDAVGHGWAGHAAIRSYSWISPSRRSPRTIRGPAAVAEVDRLDRHTGAEVVTVVATL